MRISHNELQKHVEKLNIELKDVGLFTPILLNNRTIVFPLKQIRNHYLVISLNNNDPFIYVIEDGHFYKSFEDKRLYEIRSLLSDITIKKIELDKKDKKITINGYYPASSEFKDVSLDFEMYPHKPNLFINNFSYFEYDDTSERESLDYEDGVIITKELCEKHYKEELIRRKKEKYNNFINYINSKIKNSNRKIDAINKDIEVASKNLILQEVADYIFTTDLDKKKHYKEIEYLDKKYPLDESLNLIDNAQLLYKKYRKAKTTIDISKENIRRAEKELEIYKSLKERFDNAITEKEADQVVQDSGMIKKKKETKETAFNKPYKINLNGTIIYFGRNASQNDYLSFVMKLNRDYTWLHLKDKPGSHIVICNTNPTEKELNFASEVALFASKASAGLVQFTKKKNVHRGHKLGEALLKNYSVIKVNNVSKETKEIFEKATRA